MAEAVEKQGPLQLSMSSLTVATSSAGTGFSESVTAGNGSGRGVPGMVIAAEIPAGDAAKLVSHYFVCTDSTVYRCGSKPTASAAACAMCSRATGSSNMRR